MTGLFLRLRALAADERGAYAPELALILLPFSALLLGSFDLGYQMFIRSQLQGALNDVARTATVETPAIGTGTDPLETRIRQAIETRVDELVPDNATYTLTTSNYYQFSSLGRPERLTTDVDGDSRYDPGDCFEDDNGNNVHDATTARTGRGGADDVVAYEVNVQLPRLLPMHGLLGVPANHSLTARTTVRNQPYAQQPRPQVACPTTP